MTRPLILLTNDDGIESPGLRALAAALDPLGDLLIVAPQQQQSGMGRSFPGVNEGRLAAAELRFGDQSWTGYGAHASPAQAVQHGILELADRPVDLAVAGINYGENVGVGITSSGTVGAALEAAAHGIPALAVSLEVDPALHLSYDTTVDFSGAMHFTRLFAARWLSTERIPDVDVLKIDVPAHATPQTPWRLTRLERGRYYVPLPPLRRDFEEVGRIGYELNRKAVLHKGSDAYAIREGVVAVTPISLDLTSRVDPALLGALLNGRHPAPPGAPESARSGQKGDA